MYQGKPVIIAAAVKKGEKSLKCGMQLECRPGLAKVGETDGKRN
jgi:hypothetical protein